MSIPAGEAKGALDFGGYHLVWTRDLVEQLSALLATGDRHAAARVGLAGSDSAAECSFPQNSWIDCTAYWSGLQLDQVAFPILLAWHLQNDARPVRPACNDCARRCPPDSTRPGDSAGTLGENSGYSPSTLAVVIAALACAADWGTGNRQHERGGFRFGILRLASGARRRMDSHNKGRVGQGIPRHYIRINPSDPNTPDPHADPNTQMIQIANGGGLHPARNIVGGDFLHLVRYGIRHANDPLVCDSIKVIDASSTTCRKAPAGVVTTTTGTAKTMERLRRGWSADVADFNRRTRPLRTRCRSRS